MKKRYSILTVLFLSLVVTVFGQSRTYHYADAWGKQGVTIKSSKADKIVMNFSLQDFSADPVEVKGEDMYEIHTAGSLLPNDEGMPNLPGISKYIAVPQGAVATVRIISKREEIIENINVAPAPRIPLDTEDGPLEYSKKMKVYEENASYPANPVVLSEITQIRGVDAALIGITPFTYNPVTKTLVVLRDLEIEITFEGSKGTFGENKYRSQYWDPILSDMFINYDQLPVMDYSVSGDRSKDQTGCEYLIITPTGADFVAWADTIRKFRTRQGILTHVVTLEEVGGNTVSAIEGYVDNAFTSWDIPPAAVLLLGDYGDDITSQCVSPIWDSYCVSDNIFADVNENSMPDMVFARITARNAAELELMINKFIQYEKNPPTSPDFYNHPITALGWQTERWFQICSETVGGYLKNVLGKEPVRINAVYGGDPNSDPWSTATNTSTVVSEFGPDGLGYITATPAEMGGWSGGTPNMVNEAINDGAFLLQHRDHGGENGWGEPDYSSSDIPGTTNTDLTFIFSINCLTGKYNISGECFTEIFHRHAYGALGLIAASEVSYSFVNDVYVWGLYDNMWSDFLPEQGTTPAERGLLPAFGNASGKYFLQQSSWPYNTSNKEVTYNLFHLHGGAFMTLYSEVPQDLTIAHDDVMVSGAPTFDVTVDDGAFVALTVDDEIIGTKLSVGGIASIEIPLQIPSSIINVVITKTNYYRYESQVAVIAPDGAYIIKDSFEMNDASGNNNGMIDFGETIDMAVTLKNVGNEASDAGVATISTDSEYVTILTNSVDFDGVPANGTLLLSNTFEFSVSDDIPDETSILFLLTTNDGDEDWISYINVKAYAPELKALNMSVDDYSGNNNGRLDPGETASITIFSENKGSSDAPNAMATLATTNPDVTINTASVEIGTIEAGGSVSAVFDITVNENAAIGSIADLIYHLESGNYIDDKTYNVKVGLIIEDFETGDFSSYDYEFEGSADWFISTSTVFEGAYAAQSGAIGDQQSTDLVLDYNVASDDSIHFMYKVSSESGYDYLKFYIDEAEKGSWAGEQGWSQASFPVMEGQHEFKWSYVKDQSVGNGSDCGWIDNILLPAELRMTVYAGADMLICEGMDAQLQASANMYETMLWSTAGDGVFDDATAMNPVYVPGTADLENGNVMLTITVSGAGEDLTDDVMVTINPEMELNRTVMEDPIICAGSDYMLNEYEAVNYAAMEWMTSGDGTFDDATLLQATYTPGEADLANGSADLTLTATAMEGCSNDEGLVVLTINALPTAMLSGTNAICSGDSSMLTVDLTGQAPWIVVTGNDETMEVAETPWTPYVYPTETTEFTLLSVTDFNGCTNTTEGAAMITVNALPVVSLGDDMEICHNHIITLDAGDQGEGTFAWSTGATTQTIEVDSTGVGFQGEKVITVVVTSAEGCSTEEEIVITIKDCTGLDSFAAREMSIYPNPTTGVFNLQLSSSVSDILSIRIIDALGKVILEEENVAIDGTLMRRIDISQFSKGVYYLTVDGEQGLTTKKIMIK